MPTSEKPPAPVQKPVQNDEDFAFVTSTDRYPKNYEWGPMRDKEYLKQYKELLRRLGWKPGTNLDDEKQKLTQAFLKVVKREIREGVDEYEIDGKDASRIESFMIKQFRSDMVTAAEMILKNKLPRFAVHKILGDLFEQMVGYMESGK